MKETFFSISLTISSYLFSKWQTDNRSLRFHSVSQTPSFCFSPNKIKSLGIGSRPAAHSQCFHCHEQKIGLLERAYGECGELIKFDLLPTYAGWKVGEGEIQGKLRVVELSWVKSLLSSLWHGHCSSFLVSRLNTLGEILFWFSSELRRNLL